MESFWILVHIKACSKEDENNTNEFDSGEQEHIEIPQSVNEANLKFRYSNSYVILLSNRWNQLII